MKWRALVILCVCVPSLATHATTLRFAQTSLKQLTEKISHLQHKLMHDRSERETLEKTLTRVERQMNQIQQKLLTLQHEIDQKKDDILKLNTEILEEQEQIQKRQRLLSQLIRTRYTQHRTTSWTWILHQDELSQMKRYLTYYQYIMNAQQKLLLDLREHQQELQQHQNQLQDDLKTQAQLQEEFQHEQEKLQEDKSKHATLLHTLNQNIDVKQHQLEEYHHNQINLSHLMHSLVQKSVIQTRHSFTNMHGQLPQPLHANTIKPFHQGLLFFAPEGTEVHAIYPGKIVFSDWLNGYGLLLIIDHGWGFMTLYSNNKSLLKHVGQTVDQNEIISLVGHTGGLQKDGLYFEIRHHGKTVRPQHWLRTS